MRISLIDQHPILRMGLSLFLREHFSKVELTESDNLDSFVKLENHFKTDLIIIGLAEESLDIDFKLVKKIKKQRPAIEFIIYAEMPQHNIALTSLVSGVKGYILKNSHISEVINCIQAVREGKQYVCPEIAHPLGGEFIDQPYEKHKKTILSDSEYRVALYLSQGFNNRAIARKLGKKDSSISKAKTQIFRKLNVSNVIRLRQVMMMS